MRRVIYALVALGLMLILFASAQEITLNIFGNANMDQQIDEEDISYLQGILDGKNDKTNLSDANQDGGVDESDLGQIRQIIDGTESEIYYVNAFGNAAGSASPGEDNSGTISCKRHPIFNAQEKVVGVDTEGSSGAIGNIPPTS